MRFRLFLAVAAIAWPLRAAEDPGELLLQDFESAKSQGSGWFTAFNENGLGTTLAPQPFALTAGGAPPSPAFCGRIRGHLGPNRPPYSWAQLGLGLGGKEAGPQDLSGYQTLKFWVKGDGRRHVVKLMKQSVTDFDQYRFEFPTGTEWRELIVPFSAFKQAGWGKPVPQRFDDVSSLHFEAGTFDSDYDLSIDHVRLSPEASSLDPEPYDTQGWFPYQGFEPAKRRGTALDASGRLDAPAGKHGVVQAKGEDFVFSKTGKAVRFFGINIVAGANFPTHAQADSMAEALAQMGVNMTRHHHADAPWATHNFFGKGASTRRLDPESMDRFDYLIAQLQKRGIYQYFDLLVHRQALEADGVKAVGDVVNGWKIEGEFDPTLIGLQEEFTRQLLTHKNPYTGKAYGKDPALAGMEIINEDSLWFRRSGRGDFSIGSEHYQGVYQGLFNAWLKGRYKDRAALDLAWASSSLEERGLGDDEDPGQGSVRPIAGWEADELKRWSPARRMDAWAFDGHLMERYFTRMQKLVRSLGYQGPLAGSNHWISHPADLALNARLDFVDRHAYWGHPQGGWDYGPNVSFDPNALIRHPEAGIAGELAARRVKGRPYIATEWGSSAPNDYRADGLLTMGAASALQNWSALQFAFVGTDRADFETFKGPLSSHFDVIYQPVWMTLWPAVATLLQRGDIAADAGPGAWTPFSPQQLGDPGLTAQGSGAAVFAARSGVSFTGPEALSPAQAREAATRNGWVGDAAGQVRHHPDKGLLLITTDRSAGLAGFAGGEGPIQAGSLTMNIQTPYAVLLMTSLDDKDLAESGRLLLVAGANAVNTGMEKRWGGGGIAKPGSEPVLVEPVLGKLSLACNGPREVWALDSHGRRAAQVKSSFEDGVLRFELAPGQQALAWELLAGPQP